MEEHVESRRPLDPEAAGRLKERGVGRIVDEVVHEAGLPQHGVADDQGRVAAVRAHRCGVDEEVPRPRTFEILNRKDVNRVIRGCSERLRPIRRAIRELDRRALPEEDMDDRLRGAAGRLLR